MKPRQERHSHRRRVAVLMAAIGVLVVAPLAGWCCYSAVAWLGYGRLQVDRQPDALIDRYMPDYEVGERHEIAVQAPADDTYAAACAMDLQASPVIAAIFTARESVLGASAHMQNTSGPFVRQAQAMGWGVLQERPGRELVMGAITQPWNADVVFQALPPADFASFHKPGYVKIAWTLEADPTSASTSIARTVTRVQTTDGDARSKFRRYWAIFSPGIILIRHEALRLVRDDAELRFQSGRPIHRSACGMPSVSSANIERRAELGERGRVVASNRATSPHD